MVAPAATKGVTLNIHGTLAVHGESTRTVPADGRDLFHLLSSLGFDPDSYSLLVINGALVDGEAVPVDGDIVDVFPPMCGG